MEHQAANVATNSERTQVVTRRRGRSKLLRLWIRIRRPVFEKILHINDSPHRIAFGVFLGFLVGWSPTMGAQIILYLIAATLLKANKVSGILPVMLTNPITALPIYVFNWRIGRWFLNRATGIDKSLAESEERARINQFFEEFSLTNLFSADFWDRIGPSLKSLGTELIFGCFIVGLVCGVVGYVAAYYGVIAYRKRRAARRERSRLLATAHRA